MEKGIFDYEKEMKEIKSKFVPTEGTFKIKFLSDPETSKYYYDETDNTKYKEQIKIKIQLIPSSPLIMPEIKEWYISKSAVEGSLYHQILTLGLKYKSIKDCVTNVKILKNGMFNGKQKYSYTLYE